ncbi:hypothetical protein AB0K60_11730 [Thermopolyspora sp. NPDC052614]|uniref:hypothetical protein n=1 Tax=Thermopolyspora sp. NPDC052614 TaxID=3155682 RepID=UPI0034416533
MHPGPSAERRGPWPSPAEVLQAAYADWLIVRDVTPEGRHGDWIARHRDDEERTVRAADIDTLGRLLKDAEAT